MHFIQPALHSRRAFLRRSGQLALSGTALPFALNLAAIGEAAAFNATDYKALVCVFLYGGNDYANTVVTYDDPSYNLYSTIRGGGASQTAGGIAIAKAALTPTLLNPTSPLAGGRQYALHPSMTGLADLFNLGHAAVQLNVGPLVVPLTRTQYNSADRSTWPLPPKLFSHNDQQSVWQASAPEGAKQGWGGRIGDLMASQNVNSIFTCNSVAGSAVFLAGQTTVAYQLSTAGSTPIAGLSGNLFGSSTAGSTLRSIITSGSANVFTQDLAETTQRSIDANATLSTALASAPDLPLPADLATSNLAAQLRLVARMIASRDALGARRQVFFVSLGGFDTHDDQLTTQPGLHTQLGAALAYFYNATVSLGVANNVTTFTGSDFGRTLTSNGDGSDHGWGSHHFVLGGSVLGQRYYGTFPIMGLNNNDEVGSGRLLPTTSVDQFAATLARWFGVSESNLSLVLPNIGNFGSSNVGFMGG